MTGRIGIFRTECRTKGINIFKCLCISFAIELSAYGQIGLFAKEIPAVINAAIFVFRHIIQIQRGNLEHFSGTFTVTSGDQWCMNIYKFTLLEKFVNCIGNQRTHTEYRLKCICSRTQMTDRTQVLKRMSLLLKRIISAGSPFNLYTGCLNLKWLLCFRCRNQSSFYDHGSTYI